MDWLVGTRLNDRSPVMEQQSRIKYRLGRSHAQLTVKGDGGLVGRKVELGDCFGVGTKENTMGVQVPIPHPNGRSLGKTLSVSLVCAVSLSERILGYEPREVSSTLTLRATPMRQIGIL